jgi:hypothetical protein
MDVQSLHLYNSYRYGKWRRRWCRRSLPLSGGDRFGRAARYRLSVASAGRIPSFVDLKNRYRIGSVDLGRIRKFVIQIC